MDTRGGGGLDHLLPLDGPVLVNASELCHDLIVPAHPAAIRQRERRRDAAQQHHSLRDFLEDLELSDSLASVICRAFSRGGDFASIWANNLPTRTRPHYRHVHVSFKSTTLFAESGLYHFRTHPAHVPRSLHFAGSTVPGPCTVFKSSEATYPNASTRSLKTTSLSLPSSPLAVAKSDRDTRYAREWSRSWQGSLVGAQSKAQEAPFVLCGLSRESRSGKFCERLNVWVSVTVHTSYQAYGQQNPSYSVQPYGGERGHAQPSYDVRSYNVLHIHSQFVIHPRPTYFPRSLSPRSCSSNRTSFNPFVISVPSPIRRFPLFIPQFVPYHPPAAAMVRCSGMTQRDTPCKRDVNPKKSILYPRGAARPFYCHDHLSAGLENRTFRCLKHRDKIIDYNDFISSNLETRTQVLLRERMRTPPSNGDKAGYIYGLQIEDRANPDLVHIKVGRTKTMNRRMAAHLHTCPSSRPIILGYYPRPDNATEAELSLARVRPSSKVPFAGMLEDLVHLQLADIAANVLPSGAVVPGGRLGVNRRRTPCIDCGHVHEEIFTFPRLVGDQRGLEWELLVLPVIEVWGAYVRELV